jgi:hypothetical protein
MAATAESRQPEDGVRAVAGGDVMTDNVPFWEISLMGAWGRLRAFGAAESLDF